MTTEYIDIICENYNITNYTINEDLSIDVDGDVYLCRNNLKEFPLKFINVSGWFNCSDNKLTSLKGAPSYVGKWLDCNTNSLKSLEGAPSYVGGSFYCSFNQLTSLEGAPSYVVNNFYCTVNPLESLKGIPLNLTINKLSLPINYSYDDYLLYCKVVERDLKFKKLLK